MFNEKKISRKVYQAFYNAVDSKNPKQYLQLALAKVSGSPYDSAERTPSRSASTFPIRNRADYALYVRTEHWKLTRAWAIRRMGRRCVGCGKRHKHVQVHHKSYRNLWAEVLGDLEIRCGRCHTKEHTGIDPTSLEAAHLESISTAV